MVARGNCKGMMKLMSRISFSLFSLLCPFITVATAAIAGLGLITKVFCGLESGCVDFHKRSDEFDGNKSLHLHDHLKTSIDAIKLPIQETMAAETFLVAFLQVLVDKLAQREVFKYFGLVKGVDQKLKKWSATLIAIGAVLNDAEERQLTAESNALKLWLDDLRDLAFDAEDVLDKYHTKMLKRQIQHAYSSTTSKAWKSIPNRVFNFKMNLEIQKITERLQEISERKDQLGLKIDTGMLTTRAHQHISPSSSLPDGPVIGREEDKRKIVELLSKQEHRIGLHIGWKMSKRTLSPNKKKKSISENFLIQITNWVS